MPFKIHFIEHRKNALDSLAAVDPNHGVEIDIRSDIHHPGRLIVTHDAWGLGAEFTTWIKEFLKFKLKGLLIINTKEDQLEETIMNLMKKNKIENYVFLDTTIPTSIRWVGKKHGSRLMVRVSEYETAEFALRFKSKVKWIWLDCFYGKPVALKTAKALAKHFKICLVSPELHGLEIQKISKFKPLLPYASAICTKSPSSWQKLL